MTGPRKEAIKNFCVRKIHENGPMNIHSIYDLMIDSLGTRIPSRRVVSGWLSTDTRLRKDNALNVWALKDRSRIVQHRWDRK